AYSLHTPLYESVTIDLDNGRAFEIRTTDPGKPFIASARLNGEPLERAWIAHSEIVRGGVLEFTTSSEPDTDWGSESPCRTSLDGDAESPCARGGGR
ncbi:MAG: glycoside hydrolase family 92 protein, partial [Proteobacteria bacterium]|nr:glycoside hydrolase family 92 protein [Pseudomonadota bacterium]